MLAAMELKILVSLAMDFELHIFSSKTAQIIIAVQILGSPSCCIGPALCSQLENEIILFCMFMMTDFGSDHDSSATSPGQMLYQWLEYS